MRHSLTPLGAVIRGLVAGAVGIAAMDLVRFARHEREGGERSFRDWEFSSGLTWETAPAPAQVGKRIMEGVFQRELSDDAAPVVNNVTHWAYGLWWGSVYGILAGSTSSPKLLLGLPFGVLVWTSAYVVMPLAKLYKPIWEYDAKTLWMDLSAHIAYGLGTAATFRLLAARPD